MENCAAAIDVNGTATPFGFGSRIKITGYDKPTAEIFIREPGAISDQPVLPTLINASQAVAETINLLAEYVISV